MGQRKPKEDKALEVREFLTPISLVPGEAVSYDENSIIYSNEHDITHLSEIHLRGVVPPDDVTYQYDTISVQCAEETHRFRMAIAAKMAPVLNAKAQAMPHATYEEKKALANWVNDQLEPLGLAVRCPKTGLPGKLRAQAGNWPGIGRFAIEVYSDGKRKTPSASDKLPELSLTDASPQKEAEAGWQQVVGPKESREGRRR